MNNMVMMMKLGVYRHYKGPYYIVHALARDTITLQPVVVYQQLYDGYGFWTRPMDEFESYVSQNNNNVKRFTFIGDVGTIPPTIRE